jgi:adenylate cyclase
MRPGLKRQWQVYGRAIRFAAVLGAVFGAAIGAASFKPLLLGAAFAGLSAIVYAVILMGSLGAVEIFAPRTRFGQALDRAPFFALVAAKCVIYLAVVMLVVGNKVGPQVALLAFDAETARLLAAQVDSTIPRGVAVTVAAMMVSFTVLVRQATLLIGERNLRDIMLGRYRRPRSEERFFLFIDIVGSTPVAERLGPLSVHRYLDRVFQLASDPIDEHEGEVFQYVGDEIVVTWAVAEGRKGARPLACLFAVQAALRDSAPGFEREFGTVPQLRAALHAGEVIAGEVGGSRRSIVFHGDVMNTTSRLENLTRELGKPFLVSAEALAHLDGTQAWKLEDLGDKQLRGRQAPLRAYAVSAGS